MKQCNQCYEGLSKASKATLVPDLIAGRIHTGACDTAGCKDIAVKYTIGTELEDGYRYLVYIPENRHTSGGIGSVFGIPFRGRMVFQISSDEANQSPIVIANGDDILPEDLTSHGAQFFEWIAKSNWRRDLVQGCEGETVHHRWGYLLNGQWTGCNNKATYENYINNKTSELTDKNTPCMYHIPIPAEARTVPPRLSFPKHQEPFYLCHNCFANGQLEDSVMIPTMQFGYKTCFAEGCNNPGLGYTLRQKLNKDNAWLRILFDHVEERYSTLFTLQDFGIKLDPAKDNAPLFVIDSRYEKHPSLPKAIATGDTVSFMHWSAVDSDDICRDKYALQWNKSQWLSYDKTSTEESYKQSSSCGSDSEDDSDTDTVIIEAAPKRRRLLRSNAL